MEKQRLRKKIKGLSLISLTIAVVILIIISSLLIYNAKNGVKIRAYKMLQNDVQLLEDKVNAYYVKYSAIPAEIEYVNTTLLNRMFNENKKSPNDGEEYYVIDLKALEGVTLNYGKDYENISTEDDTRKYEDVYIINKESHHIYYVKGINFDGKWYYTNENDDEVEILEKKGWKKATVSSLNDNEAYAIDNRGGLYIVPVGYYGNLKENTDYITYDERIETINKFANAKIVKILEGMVLDENGKVYTWGYNEDGQLGNGTTRTSTIPICISDKENELKGKRIVDISAGLFHTVALDEGGKVYTWGYNRYGQLGNGTTENSTTPICISDKENEIKGKKIVKIVAEGYTTVALDENGKVYTWGYNEDGQLGNGTTENSTTPICISNEENELKDKEIVDAVIGYNSYDSCMMIALDKNGKVYTWGDKGDGQLGDGTTENSTTPICISDKENAIKGKKIVKIVAEGYTTVALDKNGKVYTWGRNNSGQLGDGTTEDSTIPICISDKENELKDKEIVDAVIGYNFYGGSCMIALDKNGKVYTWGRNYCGQLGDGTTEDSTIPICISDKENAIKGKKIVKVSNDYNIVALDEDGKVYTWGYNRHGQLGNGTTENSTTPKCISNEENELKDKEIVDAVIGYNSYDYSCMMIALDKNGKVYTWGYNRYGQLGNGTTENSTTPICISNQEENMLKNKKISDIITNYDGMIIVLDQDGKIYMRSAYDYITDIGEGRKMYNKNKLICVSDKENVLKEKKIVKIEKALFSFLALDEDGKVYTLNYKYQGMDDTTDKLEQIICISDKKEEIKDKKIVYACYYWRDTEGMFLIDEEGVAYEITNYNDISLSQVININNSNDILNDKKITKVLQGNGNLFIIDDEGRAYATGNNSYGQLGDGTTNDSEELICVKENIKDILINNDLTIFLNKNNEFEVYGRCSSGNETMQDIKNILNITDKMIDFARGRFGEKIISVDSQGKMLIFLSYHLS